MTRRLPSLRAAQVMRALERAGLVQVRSKGSHRVFQHPTDPARRAIVSDHRGKDIPHGTLRSIIDQAGLTVDEFIDLL
jgi:predicted RNA binding protein YcfA (HicA-like mRNA interferase family)